MWVYPRPPRLETTTALLEVWLGGVVVASTRDGWRVLETSHPPTYYLPHEAFAPGVLRAAEGSSYCEWKGRAAYYDLLSGGVVAPRAAWTYPQPTPGFEPIVHALAVMPALVERCAVDGETVVPQAGGFYGGWVTSRVAGPFKGEPGSMGW
ncbi:uncharacterized protein (DUF427 family) [Nocardioides ginsengisegetis]|uniref:Uncharacterized protein (DUF427 family) n=1 Tax=Nocardioides ginsengisegetis TaxID=661491 RepID=A0A7W3J3P4_9ACTN|nr:uncharacterized protein (DUF427 family) [Nocardioides ginsengisegetis]